MDFFKRREPAGRSDRSGTAPRDDRPGTPAQDERFGTSAQYDPPGTSARYERQDDRPGTSGQYQRQDDRPGTSGQYQRQDDRPGTSGQYERQDDRPGTSGRHERQDERRGMSAEDERTRAAPRQGPYGTGYGAAPAGRGLLGRRVSELLLGLASLVIGLIVAFHPYHSLRLLVTLLGVLMIISGVFHVVRSIRRASDHRMWGGIAGVLFFLVGIFMLRHISLALGIISLFAGFAFIIAGIASLAEAISGRGHIGRAWSALFGLICLFAGIAAITTPIHTAARLAIVLGWAFAAMGLLHMIDAVVSRWSSRHEQPSGGQVTVPGQRTTEPAEAERAHAGRWLSAGYSLLGSPGGGGASWGARRVPRSRRDRLVRRRRAGQPDIVNN